MTMYLGPIVKGVTRRNQIFNYDPQRIIDTVTAIEPTAKYLFVDLEDISAKKQELMKPDSVMAQAYTKLEKALKKQKEVKP